MTRYRGGLAWVAGPLVIVGAVLMLVPMARAATLSGSQGIDTALPATASALTVRGRDQYRDLAISVNQTKNLTNQAVSITWTGGIPTESGPGRFGRNFVQIFQCWGDDDGTVPDNPGPPPEQCEQGAIAGDYGGVPGGLYPPGFALTRVISRSDWENFDPTVGHLDVATTNVWMPFRSVKGDVINTQIDANFNPSVQGGNFWLNPYYGVVTTNEIGAGATGPDGTGAELFQVLTGVQSSGLGCGQTVQPVEGGGFKVPQCWIVVVPRGTPTEENVGTPFATPADQFGVATSPLAPAAWQHRIAIPIEFSPVDSPCQLGADERRLSGSELALAAVASWQPLLCTVADLPPFSFAPVSDAAARQQLALGGQGAPGMIAVTRPLDETQTDPLSPAVYTPLTASGIVIGFNVERNPRPDAPASAQSLAGVRVAEMQLTPRLVAKLLTQSYRGAVDINSTAPYDWVTSNPAHLGLDPDFLQFNPEFTELQLVDSRAASSLQLPAGNSDAAELLWSWILADPEARAWLDGRPDEWGMKVNPVYSTSAEVNPTGLPFGEPAPSSFPKSDPYCYEAPPRGPGNSIVPPPLCGTDWVPYARGFNETAQITRQASDGAKVVENPFAVASSGVWARVPPQYLGRRGILSVTDSPSARLFGVQTARLSRAGDDGASRAFVAPDAQGLTAGVAAMVPGSEPTVLETDPALDAPGAYPLTTITYGVIKPLALDDASRSDYAAFVEYATGAGQVEGDELGQLPRGYVPLDAELLAQAEAARDSILSMQVPTTTTTTTTPTVTTVVSSSPVVTTRRPRSTTTGTTSTSSTTSSSTTTSTATAVTSTTAAPATTTTVAPVTPSTEGPRGRYAVPGLGMMALGSALGALEITKRPRRAGSGSALLDGPNT